MKPRAHAVEGGADRITIKGAAALLGVSEMTLRRWDKAGKFKARRHPINNYRFYRRDEVLELRRSIEAGTSPSAASTAMA